MRRFEFDPLKSLENEIKHGIDLEWAQRLWGLDHVIVSARRSSGEARYYIIAKVDEACFTAVFTALGGAIRLISCHRADSRLERIYEHYAKAQETH